MENAATAKMDQQTREEMQTHMMMLRRVAETARAGKHVDCYEIFNDLRASISKSRLSIPIRERIVSEGERYCFEVHQEKLQEFFDEAMNFTRTGDTAQRNVRLKKAAECVAHMKHLTKDDDYIREMEKRLELIRETSEAGQSRGGKNFKEGDSQTKSPGSGKRRYLRYDSPTFLVSFPKESQSFRSMDYSMVGMLVDGMPPSLREGKEVHVTIAIEGMPDYKPFQGDVLVERFLTNKGATALSFKAVEGPTMYFSSNRMIDLSSLKAI